MRKLMWFAIGFASVCAAGAYMIHGIWLFLLLMICVVAGAVLLFMPFKSTKAAAIAMLGCIIACLWMWGYDSGYLSYARNADGNRINTTITVTDFSEQTDYGIAGYGKIELEDKTYRIRFYWNQNEQLSPGDQITGEVRLRYTAPGGKREPTYHGAEGVFFLGYCEDEMAATRMERIPFRYFPAVLRQAITDILDATVPADTLAFARALLLGDTSLLPYQTDTDFSVSGIRHVIAVSGLHVTILFSLVVFAFGENRKVTSFAGILVLALFAAIAGFTPSVVRACIMQSLMLLAIVLNREYDPPTALSFAVLVMLMINPIAITSVSLQLSAGCVIGIQVFYHRIHDYLLSEKRLGPADGTSLKARLTRWFVSSVSVTLGAMIATTPLCALYFGSVSLVGIVTNLLTLWVISFVFYGLMAACILGAIWVPLGRAVAWVIAWPIRYVIGVAEILASLPVAAVYTCSPYIVLWLIFCYVLLALFLLGKPKKPLVLGSCMVVGLCVALAVSWLEPQQDAYRVTVMDVGEGQCILLQKDESYYLVDCGGDYAAGAADVAAEQLLSQGITRLDGIILTHYDEDHAGGIPLLLTRIQVGALYIPDQEDVSGIRDTLTQSHGPYICWIGSDETITIPDANITIYGSTEGKSSNESGLCVLFQPENCDILITGDRSAKGERQLLDQWEIPDLEILIVGHHGAKSSTSLELLHATTPEIAVISVGKNSYGHPSEDVLERLEMFECQIYRTDILGTIIFRG